MPQQQLKLLLSAWLKNLDIIEHPRIIEHH